MSEYFTSDFFDGNRKRLRELFTGSAPIIITGNGLLQSSGESAFPFRQDRSFWYLTGVDVPDAILVMDKDREYLIIKDQSPSDKIFGSPVNYTQLAKISGIEKILDDTSGWKLLSSRLKRVRHIATIPPADTYIEHYGFYSNPTRSVLKNRIMSIQPSIKLLDLSKHLAIMRTVKQPEEINAIKSAVDITCAALKKVEKNFSKYYNEYEVEADITHGFRSRGADGHAFEPIIASGLNSTTLHYNANKMPINKGDAVVVDVGAQVSNYAADICRTYYSKVLTKRHKDIHEAVIAVQDFAFNQLKPGILLKDYAYNVEHFLGEKLRELGLIKVIKKDSVRKYCPHSISHYLGLDVHDYGDYDRPLEAGVVLTVEPGIYVPKENIGVRIEDDVLITDKGIKILSASLPRTAA